MSKVLVTGANGHLGNNMVRYLLAAGDEVIAGVRNMENLKAFEGLACEIKYVDLLNKQSLLDALTGVEILYQVAAVFKRWSKNPLADIINPNIEGTRNILEAAAGAGVKKVVYISSIAAVDTAKMPWTAKGWNPTGAENPYAYSKTVAEKLAHQLAEELHLNISFILPTVILGPNFFSSTPVIKNMLENPFHKKMPFDPSFKFLIIDARDVAQASRLVAENGKNGQRYIVSTQKVIGFAEIIDQLKTQFPERNYTTIRKISKGFLTIIAWMGEKIAALKGTPPPLTVADVKEFYGRVLSVDISAINELGFKPIPVEQTLADSFQFLSDTNQNNA